METLKETLNEIKRADKLVNYAIDGYRRGYEVGFIQGLERAIDLLIYYNEAEAKERIEKILEEVKTNGIL